jgi:hypothetical protein
MGSFLEKPTVERHNGQASHLGLHSMQMIPLQHLRRAVVGEKQTQHSVNAMKFGVFVLAIPGRGNWLGMLAARILFVELLDCFHMYLTSRIAFHYPAIKKIGFHTHVD